MQACQLLACLHAASQWVQLLWPLHFPLANSGRLSKLTCPDVTCPTCPSLPAILQVSQTLPVFFQNYAELTAEHQQFLATAYLPAARL